MAEPREYSPSDFLYGPVIGEGRFGSVVYAKHSTQVDSGRGVGDDEHRQSGQPQAKQNNDGQGFAIKMIPKSEILRYNLLKAVMAEKRILSEVLVNNQHDEETASSSSSSAAAMIPKLFCCFHDDSFLYFVLELCSGGTMLDLFDHCAELRLRKRRDDDSMSDVSFMDKAWIRYYAGQLVRVLEYIHQRGVIHRDISPQNILFTSRGTLKLCDFGSALVIGLSPSGYSARERIDDDFVGTADYVCPEMIRGSINSSSTDTRSIFHQDECLPAIDLWSLGCLIFKMCVGESPFHAESDQSAFQRVLDYANQKGRIKCPTYIDLDENDLILSLLMVDPSDRIGLSDGVVSSKASKKLYHSLREHDFFNNDNNMQQQFWTLLENDSLEPPYKPVEQSWMTQHRESGLTMKCIDEMYFEL